MKKHMNQFFTPGDVIYGFCNGFFGRNDYDEKKCVMVTKRYAVFENEHGYATVLNDPEELTAEMVAEWKSEPDDEL